MKRLLVVALAVTGLGMGACGGDEKKKDDGPTFTPAPDAQAIVGSWGAGDDTVTFDANGNYKWESIVPCGAPPCPVKATTGTYRLAGGKVALDPAEGNDQELGYSFGGNQTTVTLDGTSYTKK